MGIQGYTLCMVEYCDTPQSKERSNREHIICLSERTILRLLDHNVTMKIVVFSSSRKKGYIEAYLFLCSVPLEQFDDFCTQMHVAHTAIY